jgi:acyl-CoA thioester hydrolase
MVDSYESVISRQPFVLRRRVRWADCDPAGVVYTGKFVDYVLSAVNLFYANLSATTYREFACGLDVDTPCRGLELDFRGALWPEDEFLVRVGVAQLRESSFDLRIGATRANGEEIFIARFSPICIPRNGERRRVSLPSAYREALSTHIIKDIE